MKTYRCANCGIQLQRLTQPYRCPQCGAVFHEGRWQWLSRPVQAHEEMCPACHRIHDEYPAGFVHVGGTFFKDHREELLHRFHLGSEDLEANQCGMLSQRQAPYLVQSGLRNLLGSMVIGLALGVVPIDELCLLAAIDERWPGRVAAGSRSSAANQHT